MNEKKVYTREKQQEQRQTNTKAKDNRTSSLKRQKKRPAQKSTSRDTYFKKDKTKTFSRRKK